MPARQLIGQAGWHHRRLIGTDPNHLRGGNHERRFGGRREQRELLVGLLDQTSHDQLAVVGFERGGREPFPQAGRRREDRLHHRFIRERLGQRHHVGTDSRNLILQSRIVTGMTLGTEQAWVEKQNRSTLRIAVGEGRLSQLGRRFLFQPSLQRLGGSRRHTKTANRQYQQ
ncbi:MAG: hypothetical protein R3B96_01730 [Pirellulaceae bacterium]